MDAHSLEHDCQHYAIPEATVATEDFFGWAATVAMAGIVDELVGYGEWSFIRLMMVILLLLKLVVSVSLALTGALLLPPLWWPP